MRSRHPGAIWYTCRDDCASDVRRSFIARASRRSTMRRNLAPEDLGYLLTQPKLSTLATHWPDGTILLSPVWHEWIDGGFTVLTSEGDVKLRHLRRDPRTSIVLAEDVPPYRGI